MPNHLNENIGHLTLTTDTNIHYKNKSPKNLKPRLRPLTAWLWTSHHATTNRELNHVGIRKNNTKPCCSLRPIDFKCIVWHLISLVQFLCLPLTCLCVAAFGDQGTSVTGVLVDQILLGIILRVLSQKFLTVGISVIYSWCSHRLVRADFGPAVTAKAGRPYVKHQGCLTQSKTAVLRETFFFPSIQPAFKSTIYPLLAFSL